MNDWILRNSGHLVGGLAIVVAALTVVTIYVLVQEEQTQDQIGPKVKVVGPCRTFGPDHPECKRQAKLIFESCIRHDLHPACTLARLALEDRAARDEARRVRGGGRQQGSPPSQQPAPGNGGSGSGGGIVGKPPTNPPKPPSPPPPDPVLKPVCDLTDELNLPRLC